MDADYGVTYELYTSYSGKSPESEFARLKKNAVRCLNRMTHNRALILETTSYKYTSVQDAICRLIDQLYVQEQTAQGTGVKSVSNDGYSESYEAATPEQAAQQLRQICVDALSGTGLMSAL